jgi:hypothetical protein
MRNRRPFHKSNLTSRRETDPDSSCRISSNPNRQLDQESPTPFRLPDRPNIGDLPSFAAHHPNASSMQEHPSPRRTKSSGRPSCEVCREIVEEFTDTARWLAGADATPDQFRNAVAAFEARKLARFGFNLDSAVSVGSMVHFNLRFADNGELCASMDVDAHTGEVIVQHACA